jgi:predicted proteasome-type protease
LAGRADHTSGPRCLATVQAARRGLGLISCLPGPISPYDEMLDSAAAPRLHCHQYSTIRSNLSVGPPLDLVLVKRDRCEVARHINIDHGNAYFASIRRRWSKALREVFKHLPEPDRPRSPQGSG